MARKVPIIDISGFIAGTDPDVVAAAVDRACREIGFLVITGHGVSEDTLSRGVAAMRGFFALPLEEKSRFSAAEGDRGGYSEFANMSLGQSLGDDAPADLRESFGAMKHHLLDPEAPQWSGEGPVSTMRLALMDYYFAMNQLADTLMEIFAVALGLERDFFAQLTYRHDSNLGVFHYPPMTAPPLPGQLRGGAHTDFGGVTILYAEPSVAGLQVWDGEEWEDVPAVEGAFVINLGDLMQRWTNDNWKSTLHRVANPADGDWDSDRVSVAFFHQPNHDALIASLDRENVPLYEPITSGEHFFRKLHSMNLAS